MTPKGISASAAVLAAVSPRTIKIPTVRAVNGTSLKWSLPMKKRMIWRLMVPTTTIITKKSDVNEVTKAVRIR
jgi:hypothetical protein